MDRYVKTAVVCVGYLGWVILAGCGGGHAPSSRDVMRPAAISDGAHEGVAGFYFLPPITADPEVSGIFDRNLVGDLEVKIVQQDPSPDPGEGLVASFTNSADNNSEAIRVNESDEHYIVNFHTDLYQDKLQDGAVYRIFVQRRSDHGEYGFADVQIFTSMKQAKSQVTEDTFALKDGRTLPVKFRIEVGAQPKVPGSKIAFGSNRDGNWEIYVMDPDGSNQVNITNSPGTYEGYPRWSPDGKKIAFASDRDGNCDIWVMDANGSNWRNLTQHPAHEEWCAWSPDGSWLAFDTDRHGKNEIYVMNAEDGSGQRNISNHPAPDEYEAWSPDGKKIAFSRLIADLQSEVFVGDLDDASNPQQLVNVQQLTYASWFDGRVAWSPDATQIAFATEREQLWRGQIYLMNADGSGQANTSNSPYRDDSPCWSPDGNRIVFHRAPSATSSAWQIWVMDADGSNQQQLTDGPGYNSQPSWSPYLP